MQNWSWLDSVGHPGWQIAAAADFDRDGALDLVWQNDTTRQLVVWYMGGTGGAIMQSWNWLDAVGHQGWSVTK